MKENKNRTIILIIAVISLVAVVLGATYAYFMAQLGSGAKTDVNITAESVDSLTFTTGDPISFSLTQENFVSGGNNVSGTTSATASLIAGKDTNASYNYYVYLSITNNEFIYTTEDKKPELILKVTGPNGAVTTIDELTYNETLGGFDITMQEGVFAIASNYEITTTSSEMQTWNIEIEAINLETNQAKNAGALFNAEVKIQRNPLASVLADVCANGDNLAKCLKDYADNSTYSVSKIIHHDGSNEYDANDDSYRYTGGNYKIKSKYLNYDYAPLKGNLIKLYCGKPGSESELSVDSWTETRISRCTSYYYKTNYDTEKFNTYEEALNKAVSDGMVKATSGIDNYVCFGSNESSCPDDNLYRIIGVFGDKVKLVKAGLANSNLLGTDGDYIREYEKNSQYYWGWTSYNSSAETHNLWANAELNTINLNKNYLNNIGTDWANMIETTIWNVGGVASSSNDRAKDYYNAELGPTGTGKDIKEEAKIGLMYISDFYYAADSSIWNQGWDINEDWGYNLIQDSNWMYMGYYNIHTISRFSNQTNSNWIINHNGSAAGNQQQTAGVYAVPTFYLKSTIKFNSGDGTKTSPYRISI